MSKVKDLKKKIENLQKELAQTETVEKEFNELLVQMPQKHKEFILKIVDLKTITLQMLQRRNTELKGILEKYSNNLLEIEKTFNKYPKLKEEYSNLSGNELAYCFSEIQSKVEKIEKEKAEKEALRVKNKKEKDFLSQIPVSQNPLAEFEKFTTLDDAKEYYEDCYSDYFELGQGLYQEKAETKCYVAGKFLSVVIEAEIGTQRMDVGEDVYFIERIKKVELLPCDEEEYLKAIKAEKEALIKKKELELEELRKGI